MTSNTNEKSRTRLIIEDAWAHVPGLLSVNVTLEAYKGLLADFQDEGVEVITHVDPDRQGFTVGTVVVYAALNEKGEAIAVERTLPKPVPKPEPQAFKDIEKKLEPVAPKLAEIKGTADSAIASISKPKK